MHGLLVTFNSAKPDFPRKAKNKTSLLISNPKVKPNCKVAAAKHSLKFQVYMH